MTSGPLDIRHTGTVEEAYLIVAWLAENGVEASVIGRDSPGVAAFGITDVEGVGICVADEATAERALALLEKRDQEHLEAEVADAALVDLRCDECSEPCAFPVNLRGTVQECPNCGAYVDVPIHSE